MKNVYVNVKYVNLGLLYDKFILFLKKIRSERFTIYTRKFEAELVQPTCIHAISFHVSNNSSTCQ